MTMGADISFTLPPAEEPPDPFDDFEAGHHAIEDGHAGTEIVHQGIGASHGFGRMEQIVGLLGNPLLGCPDFRQFLCFQLAYPIQRNHCLWSIGLGIHAHWSFRNKLAMK